MLYYHESEKDEINLDIKPLLGDLKLKNLIHEQRELIYVNECYYKNIDSMSKYKYNDNEFEILDENHNDLKSNNLNISRLDDCQLYGLFVVAFDTKQGNVIEWQIPENLNLDNIEFKAMASGFHLMENDVVYFRKGDMYGLAAFQILKSNNSLERNVRMKSVGLLANSFKYLRQYVPFLQNQVKIQLKNKEDYNDLVGLWDKKGIIDSILKNSQLLPIKKNSARDEVPFLDRLFSRDFRISKLLNSVSDDRIYTRFALYFGPSLFCLWRCILLSKRILFFSAPPISDLCYRVYCSSQLGNCSYNYVSCKQLIKPIFYVNVMDIETLLSEPFYLACTTEKILLNKEHLFDVLIENSNLKAVLNENQKNLLRVTSSDKKRYDLLMKSLYSGSKIDENADSCFKFNNTDEALFIGFFTELNDVIFSSFFDADHSELNYYTKKHEEVLNVSCISKRRKPKVTDQPRPVNTNLVKKLGFDPSDDKEFLNEIFRFYDFNLKIS